MIVDIEIDRYWFNIALRHGADYLEVEVDLDDIEASIRASLLLWGDEGPSSSD